MKTFEYRAYNASGHTKKGLIEAFSEKEASEKLVEQNFYTISLVEAGQRKKLFGLIKQRAHGIAMRTQLYRELSVLLHAGLSLSNSFELLISTPELGEIRPVLAGVRDRIRQGGALADALDGADLDMMPFEMALIQIGERSGALGEILGRLADYLDEQVVLRDKVQTALIYPVFILLMSILIMILMLGFMMPRFTQMFEQARIALPLYTRVVLGTGKVFGWLIVLLPLLLTPAMISWRKYAQKNVVARANLNRWLFQLPFIGIGYTALVNMRFARTLSLLLRSGVSLLEGLSFAGRATNSVWVEQCIDEQSEAVRHGCSLAEALRCVPPLAGALPGWVQAGEASGDLSSMLEQASVRYQHQWDRMVARFLAILEPVLILIIGGCVLMIALAVLMPVMSLNQTLGH